MNFDNEKSNESIKESLAKFQADPIDSKSKGTEPDILPEIERGGNTDLSANHGQNTSLKLTKNQASNLNKFDSKPFDNLKKFTQGSVTQSDKWLHENLDLLSDNPAISKWSEIDNSKKRTKTSLRITFEAEKELIKSRTGDLEYIRHKLGLSARKICQLLLVDSSSWSRWTKNPKTIPPHIYRALEWYLLLNEKHPSLHPGVFLSTKFHGHNLEPKIKRQIEDLNKTYEFEISALKQSLTEIQNENQKTLKNKFTRYIIMLLAFMLGLILGIIFN